MAASHSTSASTSGSNSASDSVAGPAWNIESEYASITSPEFLNDLKFVKDTIVRIETISNEIGFAKLSPTDKTKKIIPQMQLLAELRDRAALLIYNLTTWTHCGLSVNSKDTELQRTLSTLQDTSAALYAASAPQELFLNLAPQAVVDAYLDHPATKPETFALGRARLLAESRLSEKEETLLGRMRAHGIDGWGNLYNQISGQLECRVVHSSSGKAGGVETMGLAQANGLLRDVDESRRRSAWIAIQDAWKAQSTSAAAILNGIAGWRLQEYDRRSHKAPIGFLDMPIHGSNIQTKTLDAMMEAVKAARPVGQRAVTARAKKIGKEKLDPWDLLAPAPVTENATRPFKEGVELVRSAFASVDPSMGEFVDMMVKNKWLEGRVSGNKRQGAYCTQFLKSKTPRVYQTYMGSANDIRTLAHELGHAYHYWVMRDMPMPQLEYPMTLAESASIFAETILGEHMSADPKLAFENAWQEADSASAFLLNIPARFEFEKSFYERRKKSGFVSADELNELMATAWRESYGDTLNDVEKQFWMTKLHFSISSISFYNFPYTFGALFSLSIYSRRAEFGRDFLKKYISLLRDTGSMTAEDLAMKHLGEDITQPEFWAKSLKIIEKQVSRL